MERPMPTPADNQTGGLSAAGVRERYEKGTRALRREQFGWWVNKSFIAGEQWVTWNRGLNRLEELPRGDAERVRITDNRLWPSSRIIMSKLLRRALTFEVPPSSADDAAIQGARIASAVLHATHRDHEWEDLREQLAWATWQGGTGILCVEWDPRAGSPAGVGPRTGAQLHTGDTCESMLSITEVATEPGVKDVERARWWIKAAALPPETVQEMYRLDSAPPADASAGLSPLQRELMAGEDGAAVPLTLVLTYFERPTNAGKGQVMTVVGDQVVDGPHPWPFPFTDRLNLVVTRETPVIGRWTGDTVVSAAIHLQTALNQSWSSIVEHMKLAGNARLMIPDMAIDLIDQLTDTPGEIVPFRSAPGLEKPYYLSPPSMPEWWRMAPEDLKREIDDVLGVHDVSRGEAPSGVDSGVALSLLAEQDDTPVGGLAKRMAEAWGRFGSLVLQVYEAKVTSTRSARIDAPGQVPEMVRWTGQSLAGQTRAVVPLDAVAPRSRAAQLQLGLNLWQAKVITDPKVFARFVDLPEADDLSQTMDPDEAKARRENHLMAIGQAVIPEVFDDHAKHIAVLNEFRKSARYEQLPPQAKAIVDDHGTAHEVMAAEEMATVVAKGQVNPALAAAPTAAGAPVPAFETGGPPAPLELGPGPKDEAPTETPDEIDGGIAA